MIQHRLPHKDKSKKTRECRAEYSFLGADRGHDRIFGDIWERKG